MTPVGRRVLNISDSWLVCGVWEYYEYIVRLALPLNVKAD